MHSGIYRIAEKNIAINTLFETTHVLCRDYAAADDAPVDFTVEITQADIDNERTKSAEEDKIEGLPMRHFSDEYLETLAVYRKICLKMLDFGTFLFHGSAVAVDGQTFLFTAKSGTGKSTHTRFWRELFGERAVMVNDDKPLIHVCEDGNVLVYGTPWNGKHNLDTNTSVPVRGICCLERDTENHIVPVSRSDAYPRLLRQIYRPTGTEEMLLTLKMIDRILETVPCYLLGCNMDPDAARVSYEGMKNGNTDL